MSFLGSVAKLERTSGAPARYPHRPRSRVALAEHEGTAKSAGVTRATVERVVRLGFEVRVELRSRSGDVFTAQVTRRDAADLALVAGETVFARAAHRTSVIDLDPALAI